MTVKKSAQQYAGLDLFKLFFAVCVVAIHTYALEKLPETAGYWITQGIFRLAVPFFFVTSGFLLGKRLYGEREADCFAIAGYIKRLLSPLLCIGTANGLLELLLQHMRNQTPIREMAVSFIQHMLFYPYGAMWYVQACIIGALLMIPFLKKQRLPLALLIGVPLYGWALLCNNYYFLARRLGISGFADLYMNVFLSARNGIFVGFFYLALGIWACKWQYKRRKGGMGKGWPAGLGIFYLLEIYLLQNSSYLDDRALYWTQAALAPAMVLYISGCHIPITKESALRMRKASIWIYFSHRIFYVIGRILYFWLYGKELRGPWAFMGVMLLCTVTFLAGECLREQRRARKESDVSQEESETILQKGIAAAGKEYDTGA